MSINLTGVAEALAALSVSGVTIKDLHQTADAIDERECPVLAPSVQNYVTGLTVTRESYGLNATAAMTVEYDLTYNLYYAPAGSERSLAQLFDGMIATAQAIFDAAVVAENSGAVDFLPRAIQNTGHVIDPGGFDYIGCQLVFHVTVFVN